MKLKFYSKDWSVLPEKEVNDITLTEADKGAVALKQYVVAFEANLRQGNACTKDYGDVSGTGKKPYRQKGTGMARHGSKRSPIWRGGGVVFGPKPRDYSQKLNKKIKIAALAKALSIKMANDAMSVISKFDSEKPKTKEVAKLIKACIPNGNILLISDTFADNFILSVRNIPNVFMIDVQSVNAYDIIRHQNIIISEKSFDVLLERAKLRSKE